MSNLIEEVKAMLCSYCGPEDKTANCQYGPSACVREVTTVEIMAIVETIQNELNMLKGGRQT